MCVGVCGCGCVWVCVCVCECGELSYGNPVVASVARPQTEATFLVTYVQTLTGIHPILPNRPRQRRGKELNKFCPQTDVITFALASV